MIIALEKKIKVLTWVAQDFWGQAWEWFSIHCTNLSGQF